MTTANDVRAQLLSALELDLVGPRTGHPPHAGYAEEVLPIAPSKWYLTGFLVPYESRADRRADDDGDEVLDLVGRKIEADDDQAPECRAAPPPDGDATTFGLGLGGHQGEPAC